jgi:alkaline phosphatase D
VPLVLRAQASEDDLRLFRHGVASGDPLPDRVVLWSRVTPPPTRSAIGPIQVRWQVATNERMTDVIAAGTTEASPARDFTVKVDAGNLRPGRTYYYAFDAGGQQSPIGRTRTLPTAPSRLRIASVSCSNYPAGFFNVYRCVAARDDLDLVLHLGDYIYESADGAYGDGAAPDRAPHVRREAITLADYRLRYATYRSDVDLQAAHQSHPFITVWDDHEVANNAWSGGAGARSPADDTFTQRRAAAWRAYREWLPIRESPDPGIRLYRRFRIGTLADLVMLDTRTFRDRPAAANDAGTLGDPHRTMLGAAQERWLIDTLRASRQDGTRWRLLGQQVVFAPVTPPGMPILQVDNWDGYPLARRRLLDALAAERVGDVAVLTGDIHSSWANDVPRDPLFGYKASTGGGSLAVEIVTPAISSPPLFSIAGLREREPLLRLAAPHVKYLDGDHRGYVLLDVTADRLQADWYHVASVTARASRETKAASYVCEKGSARLVKA